MFILLILLLVMFLGFVAWFGYLGHISQSGSAPGLVDNRLAICPDKRNCVCSEYPGDNRHFIEPIALNGESTLARIRQTLQNMGGTVVLEQENYLAATFSSSLFGFVDDLEVRVDAVGVVHVRSASRVGDGDLGVNHQRVEKLRSLLAETN